LTRIGGNGIGQLSRNCFEANPTPRLDLAGEKLMRVQSVGNFTATNWISLFANLAAVFLLLWAFPQKSSSAEMTFAYPALSSSQAIYWVTYEQGLFKKNI
jgi:hypothetical protein